MIHAVFKTQRCFDFSKLMFDLDKLGLSEVTIMHPQGHPIS